MKYKPYPAYKDSGVPWLGDAPEHWIVSRLGYESWIRARLGWKGLKAEEYVYDGFVLLATPNIKGINIDFENVNYINEFRYEESPEIKLHEGDVLLAKDGSTLGTVNVVRNLPRPATVNSSIAIITPFNMLNGVYLYYLFQSTFMENTIQQIKGGMGVPHLFQEDLNKFYIPLPSVDEQSAIATFLDRETTKIDTLIAKQKHLIELLQEKRTALISQAVTKGLNPDAPMKDSGVEWLGEVPAHWKVKPIKRIASSNDDVLNGKKPDEYEIEYVDISSVNEVEGIIKTEEMIFKNAPSRARRLVRDGDIIVSTVRTYLKAIAPIKSPNENLVVSTGFAVIRPNKELLQAFAAYLFKAHYLIELIISRSVGVSYPAINSSDLIALKTALPSLEEQQAIAAFLDRETAKIDTLIQKSRHAIDLLKERRTALISAAVTGKIDVRDRV